MTAKELNQGIKALHKKYVGLNRTNVDKYFHVLETEVKPLFFKYYDVCGAFELMNLNSLKIMLVLNNSHRFVALHSFGSKIKV